MVGEKELFPPGEMAFSVADTAGVVDGGVVVDGVLVVGGTSSVLLQPAVSAPIITRAAVLPASAHRLIARTLLMIPICLRKPTCPPKARRPFSVIPRTVRVR